MIYILDSEIENIPKYLDDKSLDLMIKDIAQVLIDVHIRTIDKPLSRCVSEEIYLKQSIKFHNNLSYSCKLSSLKSLGKWSNWELNIIQSYRNFYQAKLKQKYDVVGYDNNGIGDGMSLILLGKLNKGITTISKEVTWTNRNKPEWLEL